MLEDSNIKNIINSADSLNELADSLVSRANECGGNDNISVVIISADESEDAK